MNKDNIIREQTFNKVEYDKAFRKKNYRQFAVNISIEKFEHYCKDNGINKADFLRLAIDKIINKIDV